SGEDAGSGPGGSPGAGGSPGRDPPPELASEEEEQVPYPALAPTAFFCLKQTTRPRSWCLRLVCNPYPFPGGTHVSMLVILLNCVTLGMFQPCEDVECQSERCTILEAFDDFIFAFFAVEMVIKMVALGIFGQKCYLGDTWNRLDFFIVMAGMMEYSLDGHNVSLSAIRTVRVLRPLRAINRVPSKTYNLTFLHPYYRTDEAEENPFICSSHRENGMQKCSNIPNRKEYKVECTLSMDSYTPSLYNPDFSSRNACINWNQYYNVCMAGDVNPHNGAINFDNIGYAWIAIFQVITLEGWVDIMYYVMDAHSFYNFIYFILLIIVGSFFMINLCLVVIATQFSETKQRENQLMQEQRARYLSNDSTIASFSEPGSCYEELLKYICHIFRKVKRRTIRLYNNWQSKRRKKVNPNSTTNGQSRRGKKRITSIHHLIHHHPHHHHHHYHISNGSPRGPQGCPPCQGEAMGVQGSRCTSPLAGLRRTSSRLSGLSAACPLPSPPGGTKKKKPKERNKVTRLWKAFGSKLKRIVESKYFNRGIMIAILINTLSMGIEYHEQPDELTNALEISNIVFTSMFALEMLLKLLAFGLFGYIKNPYNIFDGIIVVISVWEIIGQSDGGLSVLRTFRLLRVLKLVRFMPALRRQLVVLMKTMDNVATFCMLLMLFIFIFSILGMHLFGCKFSLKTDTGDTVPDRKNFDSLLWAIVTVFQILTQEDWNVVLYNGMASTSSWAALYFVALMTFGNYVLFNLLVAILVEGFQAEGDANRSDTDEDKTSANFDDDFEKLKDLRATGRILVLCFLINLSCATTWPLSKIGRGRHALQQEGSSSLGKMPYSSSLRSSPCANWGTSSNWGSRRSSWNSLGRAPSLKKKNQSGERESLLSGEGKGSTDDDSDDAKSSTVSRPSLHRRAESLDYRSSLDLPELLQLPTMRHSLSISPMAVLPAEYQDCNGKMVHVPSEFFLRIDGHKEESYCYRIRKVLEPYKPEWCKTHEDWSLYLFSPQNRFRVMCQKVIAHKMFDHVVLVFIFLNCITIALERPDIDPHSTERVFLSVSNYIFTAIFVAEMMVKVVALGFFSGENTYLQSSWNVLDGVLVFVSIIDIIVSMASAGGAKILGVLRVLRLLRTLRPLRVISRAPGLKLVVETLISSLRPIGNIVLICCAFFIIFGILGVQLFKGKFYYCDGPDVKNITTKTDCTNARYKWVRRKYNFDNLGQALMSLFVLSSKDGWVNIMYDGLDAVGIDQQPIQNHNPWMLLYFISFLLIVSFFVLNMFVGVVVENFHKCRQHQEAEEARRREEKRLRRLEKKRRKAQRRPYYADYSPARKYIHSLCTSHYLDLFITFIIGVNVITMSMEHYNQPKSLDEALKYCNYVFTIVFVFEAVLKLVAFGFRRFFKDRWNQLDLAIVLLSIVGITLEEIEMNAALPINPTIIRIMRVLRIARGTACSIGLQPSLQTRQETVGNLGLLFMLLFFIYAALGVELFGKLDCSEENPCEGLSRHATFTNFGMAFLTLFRVSTGDNWNGIMKDTLRECTREDKHCLSYLPVISPVYFVTFVLIAQFVLVNVVVAVLMKHLEESNKEAKEDAEMDAEIELEMSRGATTSATTGSRGGGVAPDSRAPYRSQEAVKSESAVQAKHQTLVMVRTRCLLFLCSG
uniref:Voltage-dependent T-type calcium channel subunit alpha-1H n=1 Tax=Anas zonorhyncha TaxID=75864 RepID=A0A8B9VNC0_9AVES